MMIKLEIHKLVHSQIKMHISIDYSFDIFLCMMNQSIGIAREMYSQIMVD